MRRFLTLILNTGSVLLAACYLLGCFTQYINPVSFWPITFIALGFPVLAACVIVIAIAWLFINKRMSLLFLLLFFAGFKNLSNVFALNMQPGFNNKKDTSALRIISWNVRGFDNNSKAAESPDSNRRKMINFLKQANADVLLLQEFVEYHNDAIYSNTKMLHDSLGFKYFYVAKDVTLEPSYGAVKSGSAIFSRLPLTDTLKHLYNRLSLPESFISAAIIFRNKKIKLVTTHLVSMNLTKGPVVRVDAAFKREDSAFIYGTSKFIKLKHYDSLHSRQALELKAYADNSADPLIVSGDLNSVPASYTYHTIKGKLQDAFVEKGFGLGRTYYSLSPTLRIDYLFADKQLKVLQYYCPRIYLSDHYPIITDLQWR